MELDGDLLRLVGLADCCELAAAVFRFPEDDSLAQGLVSGDVLADAQGCLRDAGAAPEAVEAAAAALEPFLAREAGELADCLRKGYSILFLTPGGHTPVWPYEGAFQFVARGQAGVPSLFRTPITLDVEARMHEAGVAMKDARKTPCDSIWDEFAFLSYLYGRAAELTSQGDAEGAQAQIGFACSFVDAHLSRWAGAFMEQTTREAASGAHSHGAEYAALAALGAAVVDVVLTDCAARSGDGGAISQPA